MGSTQSTWGHSPVHEPVVKRGLYIPDRLVYIACIYKEQFAFVDLIRSRLSFLSGHLYTTVLSIQTCFSLPSTSSCTKRMANPALFQWRKNNCRGLAGDPALSRFLNQNLLNQSREATPNKDETEARMAIDSPFSMKSLSPLSPLVELGSMIDDSNTALDCDFSELTGPVDHDLVGLDLGLDEEIISGELENNDSSSSSNEDENKENDLSMI